MANFNSEKERLLCYAAGILQARLSNPGNNSFSMEALLPSSIRMAHKMIELIYDDEKLKRELAND